MTEETPQGYAIQFYFDSETEKRILEFRETLYQKGLARVLGSMGDRPHLTLAVMPPEKSDTLMRILRDFAATLKPFPIELAAIGTFPSKENVFFLTPVPSLQLIKIHKSFHQRLKKEKIKPSPYYLPDKWVPHCTLETEIPDQQLTFAIQQAKSSYTPIRGTCAYLGMVSFRPIIYIGESSLLL